MGRPLRQQAISDASATLKTGSAPDTQVPVIQRALEQVLMAGSQSRKSAEERVGASGIGRTPQGTKILTDQDFMNALQAALVPSGVAENVINRGLNVSNAQLNPSFSGLSTAAGSEAQVKSSQIGAEAQIIASIMQMMGQGAMGAGYAYGCWIAEVLYGPLDPRTWRLRSYFVGHPTWWVTRLYLKVGRRVALALRRMPWLQPPVRVLFNHLLKYT